MRIERRLCDECDGVMEFNIDRMKEDDRAAFFSPNAVHRHIDCQVKEEPVGPVDHKYRVILTLHRDDVEEDLGALQVTVTAVSLVKALPELSQKLSEQWDRVIVQNVRLVETDLV